MSISIHSCAIPVHSCSIPVDSCLFLQTPVPFLWTPVDSSGMGSFLQESVGHGEVLGGAYCVEEQRRTMNFHSSFVVRLPRHGQWHGTVLRVLCLRWGCCGCVECVLAGVVFGDWWWEQERAGDVCGWWWLCGKVVILGIGQNSHSQKLLISFLGRRLHGWYLGHKISIYVKAFMV